jgi:hypothetical protein
VRTPDIPVEVTTAFVYPFDYRWDEPVYRKFELGQRLTEEAVKAGGEQFAFYGPSEFKVMKPNDNGAWVATTALPLLVGAGRRADQGVIIRSWAERRKNSSVQEAFDKKGKSKGMATMEETTYLGHVEVVHPSTQQVLIEVSSEVKVDPFAATGEEGTDESDPAKELTKQMGALIAEAVKALGGLSKGLSARADFGLTLALTPRATLNYGEDHKPSTEVELAGKDAVGREIFIQDRGKFLGPSLSEAELAKVAKLPLGTYVAAAPPGAKVAAGDLLLSIDGTAVYPQTIARLRFSEVPAQVRVRKSTGEETEVVLP